MGRFRIGAALLAILLAAGLWAQGRMMAVHMPIADAMEAAADAAMSGSWEEAESHVRTAQSKWLDARLLTAALADHQPLEDIECLLAQLPVYAASDQPDSFAAACRDAARKIRAVADAHHLHWETFL